MLNNSVVDFVFKEIKNVDYFDINFLSKILAIYFKIQPFSSKTARNKLIWFTLIEFAQNTTKTPLIKSL